jgi:hypothetical protein
MATYDQMMARDSQPRETCRYEPTQELPYGTCPDCHKVDGCVEVGSRVFWYCWSHDAYWLTGYAAEPDPGDHRGVWDYCGLGRMREVTPWFPPSLLMSPTEAVTACHMPPEP